MPAAPDPPVVAPGVPLAIGITPKLVQLLEQLVRGAVERQHVPPELVSVAPAVPDVPPAGLVAPIA